MTAQRPPSADELAAYADGELPREAAERVEAAMADAPALQRQVDAHRTLRNRLKARFDPVLEQPVPDGLLALLEGQPPAQAGAQVIDLAAVRHERNERPPVQRWVRPAGWAIAASLVLAIVGLALKPGSDYATGDVGEALDKQLVETQTPDAKVRILLSFRDQTGQVCRGFATIARSGIACHDRRGWRIAKSFAGANVPDSQFRQAGAIAPDMMASIQAMAPGGALDADGEAEALRRGWN